jgi:hypothetical protein
MGRPPIGKRPMTAAERQRRHRLGFTFRDTKPDTKPVTKPDASVTKLELKALQERLDEIELERDNARIALQELRKIGVGGNRSLLHNEDFQRELKKHIEGLATEGRKNNATMSTGTVAHHTKSLECLLADHGITAGSKRRKTNPGWRDD